MSSRSHLEEMKMGEAHFIKLTKMDQSPTCHFLILLSDLHCIYICLTALSNPSTSTFDLLPIEHVDIEGLEWSDRQRMTMAFPLPATMIVLANIYLDFAATKKTSVPSEIFMRRPPLIHFGNVNTMMDRTQYWATRKQRVRCKQMESKLAFRNKTL